MEQYKVIAKEWRSGIFTVGFIAYETDNPTNPGEWCAVVGFCPGVYIEGGLFMDSGYNQDEEVDAQYIAGHGAKLSATEAQAFFPQLDITKYKYYGRQSNE